MSNEALPGQILALQLVLGTVVKGNPRYAKALRETLENSNKSAKQFTPAVATSFRKSFDWFIAVADGTDAPSLDE